MSQTFTEESIELIKKRLAEKTTKNKEKPRETWDYKEVLKKHPKQKFEIGDQLFAQIENKILVLNTEASAQKGTVDGFGDLSENDDEDKLKSKLEELKNLKENPNPEQIILSKILEIQALKGKLEAEKTSSREVFTKHNNKFHVSCNLEANRRNLESKFSLEIKEYKTIPIPEHFSEHFNLKPSIKTEVKKEIYKDIFEVMERVKVLFPEEEK